jgi:hypothetical protein
MQNKKPISHDNAQLVYSKIGNFTLKPYKAEPHIFPMNYIACWFVAVDDDNAHVDDDNAHVDDDNAHIDDDQGDKTHINDDKTRIDDNQGDKTRIDDNQGDKTRIDKNY